MLEQELGKLLPPDNSIFRRNKYKGGLGHPQEGKWMVAANSLDKNGQVDGGGWVESFEIKEDADECVKKINAIDQRYEPQIYPVEG